MARLSTHVLDISRGIPAASLTIELHRVDGDTRQHVCTRKTNDDGRTDQPLLSGETVPEGRYELSFHAAEYFRRCGVSLEDPPFLEVVVIRFGISDPGGQYHVPLLLSPFGYTTYRGS